MVAAQSDTRDGDSTLENCRPCARLPVCSSACAYSGVLLQLPTWHGGEWCCTAGSVQACDNLEVTG